MLCVKALNSTVTEYIKHHNVMLIIVAELIIVIIEIYIYFCYLGWRDDTVVSTGVQWVYMRTVLKGDIEEDIVPERLCYNAF